MDEASDKILLIDDDPHFLDVWGELLRQLPTRPEVVTASSGSHGLAMLKNESFQVLICDLKMPKMDGLQVLTLARRQFPWLRTVAVTGLADEQYQSRVQALGVDRFFLKPKDERETKGFLRCIELLLHRDPGGFRGYQSKSLADILQMEALTQGSMVLRITRGNLVGSVWLQDGQIIDAETEGARGEVALRRILAWKSGTFENLPGEANRTRTIKKALHTLLLDSAQAAQVMDETTKRASDSEEDSEQAEHPRTVWRLAALTREGADFVVGLGRQPDAQGEGWGTDATDQMVGWMRQTETICQELSEMLQAGPLIHVVGRAAHRRFVLLPGQEKTYLVGWPVGHEPGRLVEQSKQLVGVWDS